jgi:hypothetical protein
VMQVHSALQRTINRLNDGTGWNSPVRSGRLDGYQASAGFGDVVTYQA